MLFCFKIIFLFLTFSIAILFVSFQVWLKDVSEWVVCHHKIPNSLLSIYEEDLIIMDVDYFTIHLSCKDCIISQYEGGLRFQIKKLSTFICIYLAVIKLNFKEENFFIFIPKCFIRQKSYRMTINRLYERFYICLRKIAEANGIETAKWKWTVDRPIDLGGPYTYTLTVPNKSFKEIENRSRRLTIDGVPILLQRL